MRERLARLAAGAAAELRSRSRAALHELLASARARAAWLWSRRPPAPRAAALAFVAASAAVAAAAILQQSGLADRLPARLDWAATRALLERDARAGDAVALSPAWAERARELLPASLPILSQRGFGGEDLVGVRRVWLLAIPHAPRFSWRPELELLERAARSDPPAPIGALEVSRYELAAPTLPIAFLPDRIGRASVSLGAEPCVPSGAAAFRCGDLARVARTVRDVGGVPRPCLVATAAAPLAAPLVIGFPAGRMGRTLQGHAGVGGAPLRIAVQLEGEEVGAAELTGTGWLPFRIDTTRFAGQTRALSLVLTSPAPLGDACIEGVVLP